MSYVRQRPGQRPLPGPQDSLVPAHWELIALLALILFYVFAGSVFGDDGYDIVNGLGPLFLTIVMLAGAGRMFMIEKAALWTGLLWFRVSTAMYFGIGSVVHTIMNDQTMLQIWVYFYAEKEHIAKFNIICVLSALCVLGAASVIGRIYPRRRAPETTNRDGHFLRLVALLFVCSGYAVKYFILVPDFMGAFGDVVLPGTLTFFSFFATVGLFLFTYWCLKFAPRVLPVPVLLLVMDMASGFLKFSKSDVLIPMLMFGLAVLHHKASVMRAAVAIVAFLAVYQFIEPTTGYGRGQLSLRYGAIRTSSFTERAEILTQYFSQGSMQRTSEEFQGSLARLAYVHSAAPAIALYDRGLPGTTMEHLFVFFIPRVLWPEKPVFDEAAKYNQLINGSATSASWMGYFAEAYWDFGWLGIPLFMLPLGAIFVGTGRYAMAVMESGRWLHFPGVFLCMWMGVRTDGAILSEIVATVVVLGIYHVLANIGATVLKRLTDVPGARLGMRSQLVGSQISARASPDTAPAQRLQPVDVARGTHD